MVFIKKHILIHAPHPRRTIKTVNKCVNLEVVPQKTGTTLMVKVFHC